MIFNAKNDPSFIGFVVIATVNTIPFSHGQNFLTSGPILKCFFFHYFVQLKKEKGSALHYVPLYNCICFVCMVHYL